MKFLNWGKNVTLKKSLVPKESMPSIKNMLRNNFTWTQSIKRSKIKYWYKKIKFWIIFLRRWKTKMKNLLLRITNWDKMYNWVLNKKWIYLYFQAKNKSEI